MRKIHVCKVIVFGKNAGLAELCNSGHEEKSYCSIPLLESAIKSPEFLSDFIKQLWVI